MFEYVKSKIKAYYKNNSFKPFPSGTRLILFDGSQTVVLPDGSNCDFADLSTKHNGTICVARFSNKTRKCRVMCRISPDGNNSFSNCTSKTPTQITEVSSVQELFDTVNKNMEAGNPSFIKFSGCYIYVTGRITHYDGEMERTAALSILYLIAEKNGIQFDEPVNQPPEIPESVDLGDELDMSLSGTASMNALGKKK